MDLCNCPWCGAWTRPVMVRAHYECARCHRPIADCCDGEQAIPIMTENLGREDGKKLSS